MELVPVGYRENVTLYGGEGLQWVDGETIGRLLYPDTKKPIDRIRNVYNRYKEHFAGRDTVVLKVDNEQFMPSQSETACQNKKETRKREIRFFSVPHGVAKVCNFSHSLNAPKVLDKLFDLHEAFIRGKLSRPQPELLLLAGLPAWDRRRSEGMKTLAGHEKVHMNTIRRRLNRVVKGEPLQKEKQPYVQHKYRAIYNEAISFNKQGLNALKIADKLAVPQQALYRWLKKPLLH